MNQSDIKELLTKSAIFVTVHSNNLKKKKSTKMKIVKLENTTHNEMDDNANEEQRKEIQAYVLKFIRD